MPTKLPCEIVRDLLPLYLDGLTSNVTGQAVQTHLSSCPHCTEHLQAMSSALPVPGSAADTDRAELNYLKRVRRSTKKKAILSAVVPVLVLVLLLFCKLFLLGTPTDAFFVTEISQTEATVIIRGAFTGSAVSYAGYKSDSTGSIAVRSVLSSPWNRNGAFTLELPKDSIPESGLQIQDITIQPDGSVISALANRLYAQRNFYVGDMPANSRIADTLGISRTLGSFLSELQTDKPPYGWTLNFQDPIVNPVLFDETMKAYACVLMAEIDNLSYVIWTYPVETGGQITIQSGQLSAADGSSYAGVDLKSCAEHPEGLQSLLDRLSLNDGL